MPHRDELTWTDWTRTAEQRFGEAHRMIREGAELYNNWQNFRQGRDNATIAAALGVTEQQVADMDAGMAALLHVNDFINNDLTPTTGDHAFAWRVFTLR